jgi:hypothetical protein
MATSGRSSGGVGYNVQVAVARGVRMPALAAALAAIPCSCAVIDAELCLPGAGGVPNFYGLPAAIGRRRQHELVVYAYDLLHGDGRDLRDDHHPAAAMSAGMIWER